MDTGVTPRVLLVDDMVDAGEMLALCLSAEGFDVTYAATGAEALRLAAEADFDVAVLDLAMPEMDGYAVARALRDIPRCATMPIIALTGFGHARDVERTTKAGFLAHLVKPAGVNQLREAIQIATHVRQVATKRPVETSPSD